MPSRRASSASTSSGPSPCRASSTRQWNHKSATSAQTLILSPSFAAMTVSVASSPIFLRMASSPRANSDATYESAALASRRAAITAAMRRSTSALSSTIAVHGDGVLEHRLDDLPCVGGEALVEAALAARVACDTAHLLDDEQDGVVVAVEANLAHALHVP